MSFISKPPSSPLATALVCSYLHPGPLIKNFRPSVPSTLQLWFSFRLSQHPFPSFLVLVLVLMLTTVAPLLRAGRAHSF